MPARRYGFLPADFMIADARACPAASPWTSTWLGSVALLLACQPADPCGRGGALCLDAAGARSYDWGFLPSSIVVADLDADGHPDIVADGGARRTFGVAWGGLDGVQDMSRGTITAWSIGTPARDLAVADLDADGCGGCGDGLRVSFCTGSRGRLTLPAGRYALRLHGHALVDTRVAYSITRAVDPTPR